MTHHWDEFSKSLAEKSVPRRQTLRLLGAALAGAVLGPLGAGTAWARRPDPCESFCRQCPKSRRSNCLFACRACNNDPSRLCTDCWHYACCDSGETCCGNTCHDLANDIDHCGACYNYCADPGPYEDGACILGECVYVCAPGAIDCDGRCSWLYSDPDNCGACGNVCPASAPVCIQGVCSSECPYPNQAICGRYCRFLSSDPNNCGACGHVCLGFGCVNGQCDYGSPPSEW